MHQLFRPSAKCRVLSSRLGSLLLLFQRSPLVQLIFPEARLLGGAGLGEITKWTIATVVGLGAYDSVSGATTIAQLAPAAGAATVPATADSALSFVFQLLNYSHTPGSWTVSGALPAGLTHSNAQNNTIDSITGVPTQSGRFPIIVRAWAGSNGSGNSYSKSFTIVVTGSVTVAPAITNQPDSITINSGGNVTLVVAASGTAPTFQWYLGNAGGTAQPIPDATSPSFTTPALTDTSRYWVRATNGLGIADSQTAVVTVQLAPVFTTPPVSQTINSGATATFTFVTTGDTPTFQWFMGNSGDISQPVLNATAATFTTPALSATTAYWVRATNPAGTADSATAIITVRIPPAITRQPARVTIASGKTAKLKVVATGTTPTFQWFKGAAGNTKSAVKGAKSATLTTPALKVSTSFWVRVSNPAGSVNSKAVTVAVKAAAARASQLLVSTPATFAAWQNSRFTPEQLAGGLVSGAAADPDGDGMSNAQEFLFGLSPLVSDVPPSLVPDLTSVVRFTAKLASGPGYAGITRHYALEATDTPEHWTTVSGYADIVGKDQLVTYTAPAQHPFYRLRVWLTP